MLHVAHTIAPVFMVILLGWFLKWRRFIPSTLIGPLNRLVYYLGIPAMIFREVARASFSVYFDPWLLITSLLPLFGVFGMAYAVGRAWSGNRAEMGTFIQASQHGNLGYIGLAVCYYLLGEKGFTSASMLAGFLMLCQNFLSVVGYQLASAGTGDGQGWWFMIKKIVGNPVILSALSGMAFSLFEVPVPLIIDRSLSIISGMALPCALLVIGASLSFGLVRSQVRWVFATALMKLLILPGLGVLSYYLASIPAPRFLPGLILLAAPTATITFVMAGEMKGSTDMATAVISTNTILSALTFIWWLWQFGG